MPAESLCSQPRHPRLSFRKGIRFSIEYQPGVFTEREPLSGVLVIPTALLEPECAVGTLEDIHATIRRLIFKRFQNPE